MISNRVCSALRSHRIYTRAHEFYPCIFVGSSALTGRRPWSIRLALGLLPTCWLMVLALAGCQEAVPPPSVSFITQKPMVEIPALGEGVAMSSETLPAATGGSGELTYSLKPEVPGLAG